MIDFFDRLGNTLNDLIGSHQNNTVEHVGAKLFAEGGLASQYEKNDVGDPYSLSSILKNSGSAVEKSFSATGKHSAYNDPFYGTPHLISGYGNFFKGADTGSTNSKPESPQKAKVPASENPTDFYSRWYEGMRRFAQAEEVASRGQTTVRSR